MKAPLTVDAPKPHGGGIVLTAGERERPSAAAIFLHGRGASAEDILSLAPALAGPGLLALAPQASGHSWYPASFLSPIETNSLGIDSAHGVIESLIASLVGAGIATERIAIVGFSQGACLASDHAYRFPRRYGAIVAFTGGLIGPPETTFPPTGELLGTPVFLGSNDPDPHVPWTRVEKTAEALRAMGASVDLRRYPNRPHAVQPEAIAPVRALLAAMTA
jgi:phospholipase/carboxylesterase